MALQRLLALVALCTIAVAAGGAAVRLGDAVVARAAVAPTLALLVVVVLGALLVGARARPHGRTPYWR